MWSDLLGGGHRRRGRLGAGRGRAVAIADHTSAADDGSHRIKKGTVQRYIARTAAAIVDHPGETVG